jgi:site-specific DNA-methyltransferase (adenine-specific)
MKFKGFKVGEHYLSAYQLEWIKKAETTSPELLSICNNAEEYYSETIGGDEVELICDRKTFSFPVYRLNLDNMCDGRSKKRGNGEPVDFDLIFQDKRNRKALIIRIDEWQDPETNNYIGPNLQCYMTPEKLVKEMCSQFEEEFNNFTTSEFWVLFNLEFIDELVFERSVKRSRVKFFTDNVIKAKWAVKMYGVESYVINVDEFLNQDKIMPKSNKIIVIGNPPYNENSNDSDSRPIYNRFIETVIDYIKPTKLSMIVPSRWMLGGKGLDKFRNRMMNDSHIVKCNDYKNSYDIFPGVDIAVGVNYFLWDSEYTGPCNFNGEIRYLNEFDVVVRDKESIGIIKNIQSNDKLFLIDSVSVSKPYNIRTSEPTTASGILCLYTQKLGKQYVNQKSVTDKQNNINSWRVIVPIAPIAGQTNFNKPISIYNNNNIIKLPPSEICSEAYIVLKTLSSEYECDNFITYMKTKFFRFLLLLRIDGQNVSRDCYAWVPDQEDYSRSYNDEYLYQKYNLSQEQIEYIESKIKTIP